MDDTSATSSAHTLGPWSFYRSTNPGVGLLIEGRNRRCPLPATYGEERYEAIIVAELDEVPETEANARLIAAAPELLEACRTEAENCRIALSGDWDIGTSDSPSEGFQTSLDFLETVIAKAEGS